MYNCPRKTHIHVYYTKMTLHVEHQCIKHTNCQKIKLYTIKFRFYDKIKDLSIQKNVNINVDRRKL